MVEEMKQLFNLARTDMGQFMNFLNEWKHESEIAFYVAAGLCLSLGACFALSVCCILIKQGCRSKSEAASENQTSQDNDMPKNKTALNIPTNDTSQTSASIGKMTSYSTFPMTREPVYDTPYAAVKQGGMEMEFIRDIVTKCNKVKHKFGFNGEHFIISFVF